MTRTTARTLSLATLALGLLALAGSATAQGTTTSPHSADSAGSHRARQRRSESQAQGARVKTKGVAGRGAASEDQNVRTPRATNDRSATLMTAPAAKGGQRTRGTSEAACPAHVDSRVPWQVDVYVDGAYIGTTDSFGDLLGWVPCGSRVFYARADFTDGSFEQWGPSTHSVGPTGFTWEIDP